MKSKKSLKVFKCIRAFFRPRRAHLPCRGVSPSAVESTLYSSSPDVPAADSPLNPPRWPEGGAAGMKVEELVKPRLDVVWDVDVVCISTEGKKLPHKLLDVLTSQVDEVGDPTFMTDLAGGSYKDFTSQKRLLKGVLQDQFRLGDSAMHMDILAFTARTSDHPDGLGATSVPLESANPSSPQNDDASDKPDNSPSSSVVRSDREQESSSSSPAAFPQPHQTLPAGRQLSSAPNWGSPPIHGSDGAIVSHPYQSSSGGPGGVTMVMRLNAGVPRPGLQTNSGEATANVGEGIEYGGGKHKFVCETCGQPFSSKYNVKRHQQSTNAHKGDRSSREEGIFCGQCGQKLSRPDALKRHERNGACGKRPGGSGQGGQGPPAALS